MKGFWILRTVVAIGILCSVALVAIGLISLFSFGFGFVFSGMVLLGLACTCYGTAYLHRLDQEWLTQELRREPFPKLDLA